MLEYFYLQIQLNIGFKRYKVTQIFYLFFRFGNSFGSRNFFICCCCCCCREVTSVVSNSVRPHRRQPTRLLRPWDSPGKNTGVGLPFPSPGELPNPGIEPRSAALHWGSLPAEPQGKPEISLRNFHYSSLTLMTQQVKNLPVMQETKAMRVRSLN